nr:Arc family DNA-binding protein [Aminobacter aminovorans]
MAAQEREKYPSEAADRFQVRLPVGARDQIKRAAERNNQSMNAWIVAALMQSLPVPVRPEMVDAVLLSALEQSRAWIEAAISKAKEVQ